MNFHNVHLVFPMKIKKISNIANNLNATDITVNNFFAHLIKEIDIKRLGDDTPILPITNTVEIYKYSDAILKRIPKNALAVIQNDLLYSRKKVKLPDGEDRRKNIPLITETLMKEQTITSMKEFRNFELNYKTRIITEFH